MLERISLSWVIGGVLALVAIIPLALVALTGQVWIGAIALLIVVAGGTVMLAQRITHSVNELARAIRQIKTSFNAESTETIAPDLQNLQRLTKAKELDELATAFEQMVLALQERMNELNSIYAMGQTISVQLDFQPTLQAVIAAVQQVVDSDAAEVSLVSGNNLVVEAWVGKKDFNDTTGREYRIARGPTGMIASTKAPVFMPVIAESQEDLKRTLGYASVEGEFLTKTHKVVINSFLGIPLLISDRLIGTLTLVHHEPGFFTEKDMRQLNKLAAQASIAIDNAIQVRQRESILKAQIRELRVEIDQAKLSQQVEEITTSDYFKRLQSNAVRMRERVYTRDKDKSKKVAEPPETPSTPTAGPDPGETDLS